MYTARIVEKEKERGLINVTVEFSDGETTISHVFKGLVEADQLNRNIERRLSILNKVDEEVEKISIGDWVAPEQPAPYEPTPEEVRAQAIAEKQMELERLIALEKQAEEVAEYATRNPDIAAAAAELESERNRPTPDRRP